MLNAGAKCFARRTLLLLGILLGGVSPGCGDDDGDGGGSTSDAGSQSRDAASSSTDAAAPGGTRAAALRSLANNVVLPTLQEFGTEAAVLSTALEAYATAPSAASRDDARAAWSDTMSRWQRAELMQFGPLAAMDLAVGGEDLRDEIYAWPALNLCVVDQAVAGDNVDDLTTAATTSVNARGLGAIEYLLFNESPDNTCSPLSPINAEGTWAAFTPAQLEGRRARYAHTLGRVVAARAGAIVERWEETGGAFVLELTDPDRSGALYGTAQEGLNAVSDAMFYLDKEAKDMKLAEPAGISGCSAATCPEARESRFANRSKEHLAENLRAFQRLYLGGEPGADQEGFDDLLREMGAGDFADLMAQRIDDAIAAVDAIPGTLGGAVATDIDDVTAAHAAVKSVTDDLKSMFLTVLDLEAPDRAAGDND